jgi:hypothetical protein
LKQVVIVATPERLGIQRKTLSGEPDPPQLPASVLAPDVVPLKVPPPAEMTADAPHAAGARVVVVGRVVVVVLVEVVVVLLEVVVVGGRVVVVVAGAVVVVVPPGGITASRNCPLAPPHEPPYPSTTMKYVWPAATVGVTREPCCPALAHPSAVAHPALSSLQATWVPVQLPLRT